jgi:hypothetical protein
MKKKKKIYELTRLTCHTLNSYRESLIISSKGLVICDFLKRDMCCANYIFAQRRFSWLKPSFHS